MKTGIGLLAAALVAANVAGGTAAFAQNPPGTQVGMLKCTLLPSIGFLVGSHQRMNCVFTPNGPYPPQYYTGAINTVGLDVGFSAGGALAWGVYAPTEGPPAGGLAGYYVGGSAEVGVGLGMGANVLFGGSTRTIALQPVSVEGEVGVNLAVGLSKLELRAM